ncbi:response regulator, partial [Enterococcus faecalis]|nr:response regulator [Enterococcus faecalis]
MMYKLLIIEDEHLIRRWLAYAIDYSDIGLKVVGAAENGQEGADMIRNYLPDIVISDINMPIMDAF